jgi:hypothetical protein
MKDFPGEAVYPALPARRGIFTALAWLTPDPEKILVFAVLNARAVLENARLTQQLRALFRFLYPYPRGTWCVGEKNVLLHVSGFSPLRQPLRPHGEGSARGRNDPSLSQFKAFFEVVITATLS